MTLLSILFQKIFQLSYMGSIIVACILLTKLIAKDKIGIKFQYALWFILILRLLLPVAPSSSISVYNYAPSYESSASERRNILVDSSQIDNRKTENIANTADNGELTSISLVKSVDTSHNIIQLVKDAVPFIWVLGMCMIGLVVFINNALFMRRIKKRPCIKDQSVLSILNDCKSLMNISEDISLIEADIVNTPCVLKCIKPIIIIPENFLDNCDLINLKYVILHELAHVKRKDIFINYLVSFLCVIYWFNPVIWYGFHKMREDREICCDSLALSFLRKEEVINYGFTIIKLAEISKRAPYLPAIAGIINNKSKIERRIRMIKIFKKSSYRLSVMAITVLLITGVAFLTGATRTKADTTDTIIDGVDCTFVNDQDAVGKWETVDFVRNMENFTPDRRCWQGKMYLLSIKLLPNGQMPQPVAVDISSDETSPVSWLTWTKGYIIHHNDMTAGKYIIKEIDGSKYMFWEWMSGDVTIRGMKPCYYVLKQVE